MDIYSEILHRLHNETNRAYAKYEVDLYDTLCKADHNLFDKKFEYLFDSGDNLEDYLIELKLSLISKNAPSNIYDDLEEVICEYYQLVYPVE